MARVALKEVRKVYPGGVEAVRGVSLDIRDGEFVVLVGPSGCGKSTTLRMIAGLEEASAGEIAIGERVVNGVHPKDRDIAMVFQNYALYPHMSVYNNMAFALKMRGVARAEIDRRVRQTALTLGIEGLLDRKPAALSGGQKQRVAVGRAIVREPQCFLFDEPLSNLDAKLRVTTRAELKSLHQRLKTTTVYVTHDQEEAMTLGDRIVVMSQGRVQQVGTPLEVYRRPANRFVAGFVGTPPMNFVEGSLKGDGALLRFEGGGLRLAFPGDRSATLAPHAGKPVVLGLRPQAFDRAAPAEAPSVELHVGVVEPLGDTADATCTIPGGMIVARVAASDDLRPGQRIRFGVDMARAHIFEPGEFGVNLTG